MRSIREDKSGQMVIINMLFLIMALAVLIGLVPAIRSLTDIAKQSDNLNCPGFDYDKSGTIGTNVLDYNSSLASETLGCIAFNLYLPYIVLVVLIAGVTKLMVSQGGMAFTG